jgi:hypothetical protein
VAFLVPAVGFVLPPFRAAPWGAEADFCRLSFHTFHPAKISCRPAMQDRETVSSYLKGCSPCSFLIDKFITAGRAILGRALRLSGESSRLYCHATYLPTCFSRPHQGSSAQPTECNTRQETGPVKTHVTASEMPPAQCLDRTLPCVLF